MDDSSFLENHKSNEEESEIQQAFKDELKAILDLDFDKAYEIHQMNTRESEDNTEATISHYLDQIQIRSQSNKSQYSIYLREIIGSYKNDIKDYRNIWKVYCKKLVKRQREEAKQLEEEWIALHEETVDRYHAAAKSTLSTAIVLAQCQKYEEATQVKNRVETVLQSSSTPATRNIDKLFQQRYEQLIIRHQEEFNHLHQHLVWIIKLLRQYAETEKARAQQDFDVNESHTSSLLISHIASKPMEREKKIKVISAISPRRKEKKVNSSSSSTILSQNSRSFSPNSRISSPK